MYTDKIRQIRKKKKLTQVQLSEKLGLSKSAYGLYETRRRRMDVETFAKICRLLDVTPNELLGFRG